VLNKGVIVGEFWWCGRRYVLVLLAPNSGVCAPALQMMIVSDVQALKAPPHGPFLGNDKGA
jgi:hypothetical protein